MRGSLSTRLLLAVASAVTVWLTLLSWRGFTAAPDGWLVHALAGGLAVTVLGALLRWLRVPSPAVALGQVALAFMWVGVVLTGSPLPVNERGRELEQAVAGARETITAWAAPVPASADSIVPVLLPCAFAVVIVVDLLAAALRRVPLAGLALLAAYTVPTGLLGGTVSWTVFVPGALGFLTMLYLQERRSLGRWGRALQERRDGTPTAPLRSASFRLTALVTAVGAAVIAAAVAAVVPTLDPQVFTSGLGPGGDGNVRVENPMVDLRRDLNRGKDVELIRFTTDDPDPAYLRISVLTRYTDNEWSPGDRTLPPGNTSRGDLPAPEGLDGSTERTEHEYAFEATKAFESTWLPTFSELVSIDAAGDWSFDDSTRDFINSAEDPSQIAGLTWTETVAKVEHDPGNMARAPRGASRVDGTYTTVPPSFPPAVRALAQQLTTGSTSDYESAARLQRWFQRDGGFEYNDQVVSGNGTDDLESFLDPDAENGREGYCEQFAAAMSAMTRSLGIPTRIAVGFLRPERDQDGSWVYSAHDLHAWPEVFIPGNGWVAFEPTPTTHVRRLPDYTRGDFGPTPSERAPPSTSAAPSASASAPPSTRLRPSASAADPRSTTGEGEDDTWPWRTVLTVVLVLVLLAALLLLPRTVRARRRARRVHSGDPEDAWAELRDAAVDLALPWPGHTSTRAVARLLAERVARPGGDEERPRQGVAENPAAASALERVAVEVERSRYARPGSWSPSGLWADVEQVVEGWRAGVTDAGRRRADWWPRSVLSPTRRRTAAGRPPGPASQGRDEPVDHVG